MQIDTKCIHLPARNQLSSNRYNTFCRQHKMPSILTNTRATKNVFVDRGHFVVAAQECLQTIAKAHRYFEKACDGRW